MDVTTAIRFHPVEIALSMLLKIGLVYLLGPAAVAVVIFEILLNGTAMFNHSNLALPGWLDAFAAMDRKARGALSATLNAYADADMNVLRTAEALGVHPNTIYDRMRRIREATGLDPLNYHALTEMLLVSECAGPQLST